MKEDELNSVNSLISVIVATKDCAKTLPAALDSVIKQQKVNLECLVIDGGSTDGTVEIIKNRSKDITYWISEPDQGIAEAFNKGVKASSGQILYFLGADDVLHDDFVMHNVMNILSKMKKPYFFYGDIIYVYRNARKLIKKNFNYRKFRHYNCIPHQAMFIDKFFFVKYGSFDLNLQYAMDYEHLCRFINLRKPQYIDLIIADMHRYGTSSDVLPAHAEMDQVRVSQGWATSYQVLISKLVVRLKLGIARIFDLNW